VKGAVQTKAVGPGVGLRRSGAAIVREHHPVEVRGGEAEHAVGPEHAPAFLEKPEALVEGEVLEEMLGIDRRDVREGQALPDVEDLVDALEPLVVDVDPARQRFTARADVEPALPIPIGGIASRLSEQSHRGPACLPQGMGTVEAIASSPPAPAVDARAC
jgi:hypothetical protein